MKKSFLILTILALLVSQAFSYTSEELASKIERRYKSLKDISMRFTQETKSEFFSTLKKTRGQMYLKNPDKFRIDTPSQSVVTDGELLWLFSQKNKQVTINKLTKSKNVFKPNDYLYDFRDNYDPKMEKGERVGKRFCYKLVLTPKKEDLFITKLILWIDTRHLLVRKLEYQDVNDILVNFLFDRIKINSELRDSEFVYTPPKGIEVVDLTE